MGALLKKVPIKNSSAWVAYSLTCWMNRAATVLSGPQAINLSCVRPLFPCLWVLEATISGERIQPQLQEDSKTGPFLFPSLLAFQEDHHHRNQGPLRYHQRLVVIAPLASMGEDYDHFHNAPA